MAIVILGGCDPKSFGPVKCYVHEPAGVPCPNEYSMVIETLHGPGFTKLCAYHYEKSRPLIRSGQVMLWTRAAWEFTAREAVLVAAIAANQKKTE